MLRVQIESVSGPFATDAVAAQAGAALVARASVMGFLPESVDTAVLSTDLIEAVLRGLAERDVASGLALLTARSAQTLTGDLERALEQSEHSPMPAGEWPSLSQTLGDALLADLLHISASSLRRYAAGLRPTPGDVANRLHVLALIITDLAGAYNDFGIQRWFSRPRTQLEGKAPAELLEKGWDPDGPQALRLRGLAAGLTSAGAT